MHAPHVYLITDRRSTAGRPLRDVVARALAGVADAPGPRSGGPWRVAVQLREKDLGGRALLEEAESLRALTHQRGAALFVNGRVDVALAAGADGVHLGREGLGVSHVRRLAPGLSVGVSTHDVSEIRQAREEGADFAVFGPLFETPSKAGLLAPRGLGGLSEGASQGLPLVALGGVNLANAADCLRGGAVGVAGIRLFLQAASPEREMAGLLTALAPAA